MGLTANSFGAAALWSQATGSNIHCVGSPDDRITMEKAMTWLQ